MRKQLLIFVLVPLVLTLFSSCKEQPTKPEQPQTREGQATVSGNTLTAPSATIYVKGNPYTSSATVEKGEIATVVLKDSIYFVYNSGKDSVYQLDRNTSLISILQVLLRVYDETESNLGLRRGMSPLYDFPTGIQMTLISGNTYSFSNKKARWAGVEVDAQPPFLMEPKDILPEISVAAGIAALLTINVPRVPQAQVNSSVRTYGSPLRAWILTRGFVDLQNSEMYRSYQEGYQANPSFVRKVVSAEAIGLFAEAARRIISTIASPTGLCNDFVSNVLVDPLEIGAWKLVSAGSQSEFDVSKTETIQAGARLLGSTAECAAQAVCTGSSVGTCQVLGAIVKFLNSIYNDVALVLNTVVGGYDVLTSLAYATYTVSSSYTEDFSADIFANSEWSRSDNSVSINTNDGWLHIGSNGIYDDLADKTISIPVPFVIETRMRLVSGGIHYTLPWLRLHYGAGEYEWVAIGYLPGDDFGWAFGPPPDYWQHTHTNAPPTENQWWTIRARIDTDGGELFAKNDDESSFTAVSSNSWTIPNQIIKIRFSQPWDAVCDVDYVTIQSSADVSQ
jgi:hypothetical protein